MHEVHTQRTNTRTRLSIISLFCQMNYVTLVRMLTFLVKFCVLWVAVTVSIASTVLKVLARNNHCKNSQFPHNSQLNDVWAWLVHSCRFAISMHNCLSLMKSNNDNESNETFAAKMHYLQHAHRRRPRAKCNSIKLIIKVEWKKNGRLWTQKRCEKKKWRNYSNSWARISIKHFRQRFR